MQDLKCCAIFFVLAILVMDAAAAPSSRARSSAEPLPIRRRTNHTANAEFDEFWGHPDDNSLLNNRIGSEDNNFADDGGALMEHGALTDDGEVKILEVIGSENADSLWRLGNSDDGADTVFFNDDDFAPDMETANDEFLEPRMLLSPGEEINENLKGPGYDWSVMGKVRKVTTEKPKDSNIHFTAEEESGKKPWEIDSRPRPDSSS